MKTVLVSGRNHYLTKASILVTIVALVASMVACAEPVQYTLNVSSTEGGEITTPDEMTSSYEEGTEVPLVAFPHSGYRFVEWTGDVDAIADVNDASTSITMNDNYEITANFEEIPQYNLSISSITGGSVTAPGEGTFTYSEGAVVHLLTKPEEGYQFVNWTGDIGNIVNPNSPSTTITMNGDYPITAHLEQEEEVYFPDPNLEAATNKEWRFILEALGTKVLAFGNGNWDVEINIPISDAGEMREPTKDRTACASEL